MIFELTDKLQDLIVSAMENQDQKFLVNAKTSDLEEVLDNLKADGEIYYDLPLWDSTDGYKLREQFVEELHSPLAREELLSVLRAGKGVFRGFKEVLKLYPQVGKRWHFYKNKTLRLYINEWYNELRETWGLEKLDYEIDEITDLVHDDFVFLEYDSERDKESILNGISMLKQDYLDWPEEIGNAIIELEERRIECNENHEIGFVCQSVLQEFIGTILFTPCLDCTKKTVLLLSFFVEKKYRGLGIGEELLSTALSFLAKNGIIWVVIAETIIPETMQPLLERSGFKKIGSGLVANLFAE